MSNTCHTCDANQAFRVYSFRRSGPKLFTEFVELDPNTGATVRTIVPDTVSAWGYKNIVLATHPCTCELFGVGANVGTDGMGEGAWELFAIDPKTGTISLRGPLGDAISPFNDEGRVSDIAFRATDGDLFASYSNNRIRVSGLFGQIDVCKGILTFTGDTGFVRTGAGLASTLDGTMLLSLFVGDSTLRVVDTSTGIPGDIIVSTGDGIALNSVSLEPCSGNLLAVGVLVGGPKSCFLRIDLTTRTIETTQIPARLNGLAVVPCAPQIKCPPNVTLPVGAAYGPSVTGRATIVNACPHRQTLAYTDAVVRTHCCGCACAPKEVRRTWVATGPCDGCATQCVQYIFFGGCWQSMKRRRQLGTRTRRPADC